MGSITAQATIATDFAPQIFSVTAENVILYSLTLTFVTYIPHLESLHATIGLLEGGETLDQLVAALASGQVISQYPLGWTGHLPTGPDIRIFALIQGPVDVIVRLRAYVLPYKVTEEGGYIVDP